jgi:RNA polymerase sigma factor (sigma-70 family)
VPGGKLAGPPASSGLGTGHRAPGTALEARNALVERHRGLVLATARAFAGRLPVGMEPADLIQEGLIALCLAAQGFDPDRGVRFSTYASPWIRGMMVRAVQQWGHGIRLPRYLHPVWLQVVRAQQHAREGGREASLAELATAVDRPPELILRVLAAGGPLASLDEMMRCAEGSPERYTGPVCPRALTEAVIVARLDLQAALARLPARHRAYVLLRFGLNGDDPRNLSEAARAFGCSRPTARKIEREALARLEQMMGPPRRRPQAGRSGAGRNAARHAPEEGHR